MRRAIVVLFTLLGPVLLTVPARADAPRGTLEHHGPTAPDGGLTAAWWQQFLGHPGTLDRCDLGVPGIVFLAGSTGGAVDRTCSVPRGWSVLVPLINVECSTLENGYRTYRGLRTCAVDIANDFTGLSLSVDGRAEPAPGRLRARSGLFVFTAVEGTAFIPAGGPTRAVADGYWALVGPLGRGSHTVSFGDEYPPGEFSTSATYTLLVK